MLTNKYQGNTVDAVQVTNENIYAVAEWAGGEVSVRTFKEPTEDLIAEEVLVTKTRINVTPHRPGAWRFGSVGDWFVKDETGIVRIFPKNIFLKIFHAVDVVDDNTPTPRRAKKAVEDVPVVVIANGSFEATE